MYKRQSGLFRFFVETDVRDNIVETNESDNVFFSDTFRIDEQPRPDLRVSQVSAPETITSGTIIDVAFTVSNLGTADTPSGGSRWRDRVWLSSSADRASGILLGEFDNGSALGHVGSTSGQPFQYQTTGSFLVPRELSGNWFVVIEADACLLYTSPSPRD